MAITNEKAAPESPTSAASTLTAPVIYQLTISRFRGIKSLTWHPARGVNIVLGGGDVGKTTILDAIGLLLSPTNAANLSDSDYYLREVASEFTIEAIVSLPLAGAMNQQFKTSWPWVWDGSDAVVPSIEADGAATSEAVYRLRVRGTEDLELAFEIVQPDGAADHLSVGLRRSIGLVRLSGDDRSDRDLRLVQGSALDRLLSDKTLRSRIASELGKTDVQERLTPEAKKALTDLDATFRNQTLPSGLDISITGGPGASVASLIGLMAQCESVRLPLVSWGAGTRRLAALAIAEQNQGEHPIVLVDEIERGLEPYRQRALLEKQQAGESQVFITTHSPAAISAASSAALWYVDHAGRIGLLDTAKTARHRTKDPDTFLSRLAIIGEGITEVSFTVSLLERAVGSSVRQYGIHISDGGGHDATIDLLESLGKAGLQFGGFVDNEDRHPQRWERIMKAQGDLLFRWKAGCTEHNIIGAVSDDSLEALLTDPENELTGTRLRTLADRLGVDEKDFATVKARAGDRLKPLIIEAATGAVPLDKIDEKKLYKSHAKMWFKSERGGRELALKVFSLGLWPTFSAQLMPFCNAARKAVDLPAISDLNHE